MPYIFKTTPYDHQRKVFEESKDKFVAALFLEQRTGKTKVVIDTAAYHYEQGHIDTLIIVAWPSGVHRNWITDEMPAHMPDRIAWQAFVWRSDQINRVKTKKALEALKSFEGLAILSINAEAIITETCREYLRQILKARKGTLLAADESTWLKTPGARRTKVARALAKHPKIRYKRILDGTPLETPLDLYSQMAFLDTAILGYSSFFAFKTRYATYETGYDPRTGREFPKLVGFQNLDELQDKMAPHVWRVRREECADMPPKIYQKRYFQLTKTQQRVYDEMKETYAAELPGGDLVTASNVLTRYLRLQQVSSNFYPPTVTAEVCANCDGDGCEACGFEGFILTGGEKSGSVIDEGCNPRLDACRMELEGTSDPVLVWARFHHDIDAVFNLATELGRNPVIYDGRRNADEKAAALQLFQTGKSAVIVGNPRAGGRGLKLTAARTILYYSHDFSLLCRLQSEDRAESLERTYSTGIVDLVAEKTIDEKVVESHRAKKRLADIILSDPESVWL